MMMLLGVLTCLQLCDSNSIVLR